MSEVKLAATARTEFGKGAARRIRRAHQIPAVLYSHGSDPIHITLPGHEMMLALKHANALFAIEVDGGARLAIAKDVQRDPVKNVIEHIDLLEVKRGELVTVEVPVVVTGEVVPGAVASLEAQTVALEADATALPESVEVSVEGLEAGSQIRGADLTIPAGATFVGDPDAIVVAVSGGTTEADMESDAVADVAEVSADETVAEAEGEGESDGEAAEESATEA